VPSKPAYVRRVPHISYIAQGKPMCNVTSACTLIARSRMWKRRVSSS
jgi:hypothetical protein